MGRGRAGGNNGTREGRRGPLRGGERECGIGIRGGGKARFIGEYGKG